MTSLIPSPPAQLLWVSWLAVPEDRQLCQRIGNCARGPATVPEDRQLCWQQGYYMTVLQAMEVVCGCLATKSLDLNNTSGWGYSSMLLGVANIQRLISIPQME